MSVPKGWLLWVFLVCLVGSSLLWFSFSSGGGFGSVFAVNEDHHYVLIEVTTVLDVDQKIMVRDALLELGNTYHLLPSGKTHIRRSLDNQKVIVELILPDKLTKAQAVSKLAEKLPWSEATISTNSNFTVFGGLSSTQEESRQAAIDYLISNSAEWEVSE